MSKITQATKTYVTFLTNEDLFVESLLQGSPETRTLTQSRNCKEFSAACLMLQLYFVRNALMRA